MIQNRLTFWCRWAMLPLRRRGEMVFENEQIAISSWQLAGQGRFGSLERNAGASLTMIF